MTSMHGWDGPQIAERSMWAFVRLVQILAPLCLVLILFGVIDAS